MVLFHKILLAGREGRPVPRLHSWGLFYKPVRECGGRELVVRAPAVPYQERPRERVLGLLPRWNGRLKSHASRLPNQCGLRQRPHEAALVLEGADAGSVTALLVRVSEPVVITREGYPGFLVLLEVRAEEGRRGGAGEARVEMCEPNKEQVPGISVLAKEGDSGSGADAPLGENGLDTSDTGGFVAGLGVMFRHRGQGTGVNTGEEYAVGRHDVCLFERLWWWLRLIKNNQFSVGSASSQRGALRKTVSRAPAGCVDHIQDSS